MTADTRAVAERDTLALGDGVEPVVDSLCGESKKTLNLIWRRAVSVEHRSGQRLIAFRSVFVRSCWRNCSSSTPASFFPHPATLVSTRCEDMN